MHMYCIAAYVWINFVRPKCINCVYIYHIRYHVIVVFSSRAIATIKLQNYCCWPQMYFLYETDPIQLSFSLCIVTRSSVAIMLSTHVSNCLWINASLTHWGRDKMAAISQTTLSSAFSWKKISAFRLKFHWSLFLRVQLTIFQPCFR